MVARMIKYGDVRVHLSSHVTDIKQARLDDYTQKTIQEKVGCKKWIIPHWEEREESDEYGLDVTAPHNYLTNRVIIKIEETTERKNLIYKYCNNCHNVPCI